MLNKQLEVLTQSDKKQICDAIQNTNQLTLLDMGEVKSQNSKHFRFWDRLNTVLYGNVFSNTYIVKRGPWEMLILVKDGILFTLMRESRFLAIQKEAKADRDCQNYINLLAKCLNANVIPQIKQESLFPVTVEGPDEMIKFKVEKFLCSVYENEDSITNHVIILFEANDYGLLDIRQVIIDNNFDIAEEDNFSNLIKQHPSLVLDDANDVGANTETVAAVKLKLKSESRKKDNV